MYRFAGRALTSLSTLGLFTLALTSGCGGIPGVGLSGNTGTGTTPSTVPAVQHVAIITLENANYTDVIGTQTMPYLNSLIPKGLVCVPMTSV